jgi:hypothetical protein
MSVAVARIAMAIRLLRIIRRGSGAGPGGSASAILVQNMKVKNKIK